MQRHAANLPAALLYISFGQMDSGVCVMQSKRLLLSSDRRSSAGGRAYYIGETTKCVVSIRPQTRHRCRDSLLAFY